MSSVQEPRGLHQYLGRKALHPAPLYFVLDYAASCWPRQRQLSPTHQTWRCACILSRGQSMCSMRKPRSQATCATAAAAAAIARRHRPGCCPEALQQSSLATGTRQLSASSLHAVEPCAVQVLPIIVRADADAAQADGCPQDVVGHCQRSDERQCHPP